MNDFFRRTVDNIKNLWGRWTPLQKIILIGIIVVAIGGVIALFSVSASPSMVPVVDYPIADPVERDRIVSRINQENVRTFVNAAGVVNVIDEPTARRMRVILIREDLIPKGADPWNIFDKDRWTITDIERNINFQRAQRQMITDHIKALDDVDNAVVDIVFPQRELFASDQNPTTASVIIIPKPGSDITQPPQNRRKIEGIQKILQYAIEGLKPENIVISDSSGLILNDFAGMAALDRLELINKEQKLIQTYEAKYRADVLRALQNTFSTNRVRDMNIKIEMDMSKKAVETKENIPTVIKSRTPGLPYDDSIIEPSITVSSSRSETTWEGSGHHPEGPAGYEGQMPPAFKDMDNLYGRMTQKTDNVNEEIGSRLTSEEKSPQINRVTVSVNIDGIWKKKLDDKGKPVISGGSIEREYIPVPPEEIRAAREYVQNAVGYNPARGDSVTVQNIPFDRVTEFAEEDAAYFRKQQMQTTAIIFISGLTLLLIGFIIFRVISREMERRRRLAEEERARREQALRESAMAEAEDGMDVSISVEERSRMELMESVVNLAKEHPEDCAQLIRTWILEEN